MIKIKSLVKGIGDYNETNKYYDEWASDYDQTLFRWNYKAPKKSSLIVKKNIKIKPRNILDIACGTGLFAEEIIKIYPNALIDGADISKKIIKHAKLKNIYNNLICFNFDKEFKIKKKYDLIACIGALTYTRNPQSLFLNIFNVTKTAGYFVFTHRVDLWKKHNYTNMLKSLSQKWSIVFISRPLLYLPKNTEFSDRIKIKIGLLKKIRC